MDFIIYSVPQNSYESNIDSGIAISTALFPTFSR